jgi:hypothetical protein
MLLLLLPLVLLLLLLLLLLVSTLQVHLKPVAGRVISSSELELVTVDPYSGANAPLKVRWTQVTRRVWRVTCSTVVTWHLAPVNVHNIIRIITDTYECIAVSMYSCELAALCRCTVTLMCILSVLTAPANAASAHSSAVIT